MRFHRTQVAISLIYFAFLLASPLLGMEAHHCAPHAGQQAHTEACPICTGECLPETPLEHAFENARPGEPEHLNPRDLPLLELLSADAIGAAPVASIVIVSGHTTALAKRVPSNITARGPPAFSLPL